MEKYEKRLDEEQWGELYNKEQAEQVINGILTEQVFCWTEELLKISAEGDKMCEVGCGSGQSAAYLQRHGRKVTALDFSKECVELVNVINSHLNLGMNVVCADATKPLPFAKKEFDYIYQCGLLEHFHTDERIDLLKNWSHYTKHIDFHDSECGKHRIPHWKGNDGATGRLVIWVRITAVQSWQRV